jgi:tetratricopeptide (TPR) repeat protein
MQMTETQKTRRGLSDRTLNRLIVGAIVALVIVIPLIGVIYFLDRNTDPGPSMAQRAVTTAEEAVRAQPNNVNARLALATSYLQSERYQDAVNQYGEVLKVVTDHRGALLGRGNAFLLMDDQANATKDYERLVAVAATGEQANADPQLEEAYFRLGDIALRQGRDAEAVDLLLKALAISRTDADAMNLLGAAYVKTGKAEDAVTVLKRAIAFVPTGWCEPYQNLGDAYKALGDADGAAYASGMVSWCGGDAASAKLALAPLTGGTLGIEAMLGLGQIAEMEGDVATATEMYQKVLDKDPSNSNAIFGMQRLGTASSDPHGGTVPAASEAPAASTAPDASPSTGANP